MATFFLTVLLIFLSIKNATSTPVADYDKSSKYEEYIIEHEISTGSAKNSVLTMDVDSIIIPPGCQKCNDKEKRYCLGTDLISDHCCCDKRYHEMFPFIPHTCYFGSQLCDTVASDCTEYQRLRTCCCQKFTLEKLREQLQLSSRQSRQANLNEVDFSKNEFEKSFEALEKRQNRRSLNFVKKETPSKDSSNPRKAKSKSYEKSRGVGISENAIKASTLILFIIFKYLFYIK